jgi:hypothetical protein
LVCGEGDLETCRLAGEGDRDCSCVCFGDLNRWSFAFSLGGDLSLPLCDRLTLAGDCGDLTRSFTFSLGGDLSLSLCEALDFAGGDRALAGEPFLRSGELRLRGGVPLRSLSRAGERDLRRSTAEAIADLEQHILNTVEC